MVRTRSRVTSPGPQESRDASSNPHRDRQSAPAMQPSSVQHVQSMAAAMAELTRQNYYLGVIIELLKKKFPYTLGVIIELFKKKLVSTYIREMLALILPCLMFALELN